MLRDKLVEFDPTTGRVANPPIQVFLESTSRCNLACVHCFTDFGVDPSPGHDMPMEVVRKLEPFIRTARFVNLNGVGEPLLAANFDEIVEFCGEGAELAFNTNALLLSDERCDRLVELGLGSITISVDGWETHRAVRGVPYERVRERLMRLTESRARAGKERPHVALAYTLMKRNVQELPRVLEDLLPAGALHSVAVQPLVVFYEGMRDQNIYLAHDVEPVIRRAQEIATENGVAFTVFRSSFKEDERNLDEEPKDDGPKAHLGSYSETYGCVDPFFQLHIRSTGDVVACCYGLEPGLNVLNTPLDEIWNGPEYRDLRQRLHAKRFEGRCENCPLIFGSKENQEDSLRPGHHHSQEARFLDL
ncbi:MAG: hypothetical protein CMJ83_12690 [Planctomycetes bacterium]|nr:hypothetical protein [Planctomycetota bacterium]